MTLGAHWTKDALWKKKIAVFRQGVVMRETAIFALLGCFGSVFSPTVRLILLRMKTPLRKFPEITLILCVCVYTSSAQNPDPVLGPAHLIRNPGITEQYTSVSRKFTGIPSLAVTDQGRLWAVWYAGITPAEDMNNYVVVATSGDKGKTWEEVLAIDPDGPGVVRAFDPQAWIDPAGKLWIFWAQALNGEKGERAGVWAITTNDANKNTPSWSEPKRLADGVMMNKPTVLSGGEWLLPVSTWKVAGSAKVVASTDCGQTWKVRGGADIPEAERTFDEHMTVEKKDGSLWMLVRTKYGIGESFSKDKGVTWSPVTPSKLEHPAARSFIRRLNSGNLLFVKHGPIGEKTGRSHLMAFISKDDGETWSRGLLLDERRVISYPDGQQTKDGTIFIVYDFNRTKDQTIAMTSFTENDVLADDYDVRMAEVFGQRKVVSRGGIPESSKFPTVPPPSQTKP